MRTVKALAVVLIGETASLMSIAGTVIVVAGLYLVITS